MSEFSEGIRRRIGNLKPSTGENMFPVAADVLSSDKNLMRNCVEARARSKKGWLNEFV